MVRGSGVRLLFTFHAIPAYLRVHCVGGPRVHIRSAVLVSVSTGGCWLRFDCTRTSCAQSQRQILALRVRPGLSAGDMHSLAKQQMSHCVRVCENAKSDHGLPSYPEATPMPDKYTLSIS